ncbi:MAG: hypothetical protein HUJ30_02910 [Gammaproteobacteria bacterium]|nr:hypothetical protein [Gammaproteobacteria bacterium]
MLPATSPDSFIRLCEELIVNGAQGILLSGGSNHQNEVEYTPYLPQIEKLKTKYPEFQIAIHTALVDDVMALRLDSSGIDVAMFDLIGAQDTITQVYHLKRQVDDFENTLLSLRKTSMKVVPHIVIGLHYGNLLGEWNALEMVARHGADALILVVVMPQYARPSRPFITPAPEQVGQFFLDARQRLPHMPVMLGCARPPGYDKVILDSYAVMAGLDGIAHPSEGIVALAEKLNRYIDVSASCCSINDVDIISGHYQPDDRHIINEQRIKWK